MTMSWAVFLNSQSQITGACILSLVQAGLTTAAPGQHDSILSVTKSELVLDLGGSAASGVSAV